MSAIANYPDRCELLNLGYGPQGRGPFILRQEGSVPGSLDLRQNVYLLRKDGVWVLNFSVFALPEADQEAFFYPTTADAMKMLTSLSGGDPVIEMALPEGKTIAELQASTEQTASRLMARVRQAQRVSLTPPTP
jgi:hypothetical protein